jgi:hypothetical protein
MDVDTKNNWIWVKVPLLGISISKGAERYLWCEEYVGVCGIQWIRGNAVDSMVPYGFVNSSDALMFLLKWA